MSTHMPGDPAGSLFALELHSRNPEQLVDFYQRRLSLRFARTTYPAPRYMADLGGLALIVTEALNGDPQAAFGTMTLNVLARHGAGLDALDAAGADRYVLHPSRPLGGAFPDRYARRIRDPDGHYLAVAPSLEHVFGKAPPVSSLGELIAVAREFALFVFDRERKRLRVHADRVADLAAYRTGHVTCLTRDLRGYTHLVTSREGLFVVNRDSYRRVLRGAFFGATIKDDAIYCFQTCGREVENRGRLLKLTVRDQRIDRIEIIAEGLDDGCHQLDFAGDDLFVVDCYNGRLLQLPPGARTPIVHAPLGEISRAEAKDLYHMNSFCRAPDGSMWLLLHNCVRTPSEVVVLDSKFRPVRRFFVDAGGAHNIVFTNDDLEYLIADSAGGRVVSARGPVVDGGLMMPRGIALDETTCVVGDSLFATRRFRRYVPGRVHFVDRRTWTRTHTLSLPAAPTEVRRLDGHDLSIGNYLASEASVASTV